MTQRYYTTVHFTNGAKLQFHGETIQSATGPAHLVAFQDGLGHKYVVNMDNVTYIDATENEPA